MRPQTPSQAACTATPQGTVWVEQARADRIKGKSGGLTTAEREKLGKLRKAVRELTMERDILKEAAAYFAKHQR